MSIIVKKRGRVVDIQLNRPRVLNAINSEMMLQLIQTVQHYDKQPDVGCFVLHGSGKAFAAGADIKELELRTWTDMTEQDVFSEWDLFTATSTPKIAAVHGYALGGGCELAMMCDIIYAADSAQFGQPEIKLGVTPGMGGSQRLTRLVSRVVAMDMVLSGRMLTASEALHHGLVARIFSEDDLLDEVNAIAETISGFGKKAIIAAREAVNSADEVHLEEGLLADRSSYHALWNTKDKEVGMRAFLNKEVPKFCGR